MNKPSLSVEQVRKQYNRRGYLKGLRETISDISRHLIFHKIDETDDKFFAVKDVSFKIMPGEAFGIIGPNGAGKTTMLRLLSGITEPSSGKITRNGRIASIIELGAGFHPELTGRENIFLYAAIMGLQHKEVSAAFDDIVTFSELGEYLDMPLKHYSSGMYVRLAFSVASCMRPDVLLIDEVLAVGDSSFQSKSLRRIREMKDNGTAIAFVSHNLHQVRVLCDNAMLMHRGEVQAIGTTETVVDKYLNDPTYRIALAQTYKNTSTLPKEGDAWKEARILKVVLLDTERNERSSFKTGEGFVVHIEYEAYQLIHHPTFTIAFYSVDGTLYAAHQTNWDDFEIESIIGRGAIEIVFDHLDILPGGYQLSISISDSQGFSKYDWHQKAYYLHVLVGDKASGLLYLRHSWQVASPSDKVHINDPS